jgi:hypothetical protein
MYDTLAGVGQDYGEYSRILYKRLVYIPVNNGTSRWRLLLRSMETR